MAKITLVSWENGDWEALFVDGENVAEGHSIRVEDFFAVMHTLGAETEQIWFDDEDGELCHSDSLDPILAVMRGEAPLRSADFDFDADFASDGSD